LKDIYETPEMNLIFFESEDTICTSGPNLGEDEIPLKGQSLGADPLNDDFLEGY